MVRKLIIDAIKFWVNEYGIDGYRFDLIKEVKRCTCDTSKFEIYDKIEHADDIIYKIEKVS